MLEARVAMRVMVQVQHESAQTPLAKNCNQPNKQ